MAVSIAGSVVHARSATDETAPSINITNVASGDGIVVIVVLNSATVTCNSVDVGSATGITQIGSVLGPLTGDLASDKWYAFIYPNSTQTGTLAVTANLSGAERPRIIAFRVQGHDTGTYNGATASGTGSGADPSINLDTTRDGSMIVGLLSTVDASTQTAGPGYTLLVSPVGDFDTPQAWGAVTQYDVDAGATGTKSVVFETAFEQWGARAFEIKAASSGTPKAVFAAYRAQQ